MEYINLKRTTATDEWLLWKNQYPEYEAYDRDRLIIIDNMADAISRAIEEDLTATVDYVNDNTECIMWNRGDIHLCTTNITADSNEGVIRDIVSHFNW